MSVSALSAPIFAFAAFGNPAIGQLRLFDQTWPMFEARIDADHPWCNLALRDLWDDRSRMLIYYHSQNRELNLVESVVQNRCLQVGDRLIFARQPQVKTKRTSPRQKLKRWLAQLRRMQQQVRSTVWSLLALLFTIGLATFAYVSFSFKTTSVIDALYFSVGMITGAGGNEAVAERAPQLIKMFTVVMMLIGAAIIGLCYALLNDWVLGARFHNLWDSTHLPTHDHYIVCGLGGIGMRVVHQLRQQGYDVVAIEPDPQNRFLQSIRTLKVPIIQGDASLSSVLELSGAENSK